MICTEGIRATGLYLLEILKSEKVVGYSRFYNDTSGTEARLVAGALPFVVDSEACDADDLREEGHVELDENLMDGYPDFQIALTEKGAQGLADGLAFGFRSPDYWITATPASEWLIFLLEAGGEGMEIRLWEVMDFGDSDGDVAIEDDHGNTYRLGTRSFAWAFEVSLWHHARAGHIEPACETAEQEKLWSEFVAQTYRPSPPDVNPSQPLWHIPFRLADAVHAGKAQVVHVGQVAAG